MKQKEDYDNLFRIRHSLAHVLLMAVKHHYPHALPTIGPVIENGFYYDIDFTDAGKPSIDDLEKIEKTMKEIIKKDLPFRHEEVTADQARARFENNLYKKELIDDLKKEGTQITLYYTGDDFYDLCVGGHTETTGKINADAFKLEKVAGAYWRGNEKNAMLTRIYGLAFETKEKLEAYTTQQEEAKKRDHRVLGKQLKLYTIINEVGAGLPLFYPAGAILRRNIEDYITKLQEAKGYVPIWIPHITKGKLYEISGHLDKYDAMYTPMKIDDEDYYLKPMNCPHFMMLYKTLPHSYKELPLRYTCTTTNYRYEKSGELSGLTRVRSLTQDDCHVFCMAEQIEGEITLMTDMVGEVYKTFGFNDFWVRISLRDQNNKGKYLGEDSVWETAESALRNVVKKTGWDYKEAEDEAAFYGPKLDFMLKDAIGREWQLSTIQLDFNLPKRFELEYTDTEGKKSEPVVIHRALLGSTERFMGIMIEHFAGNFPLWLSPTQISILPIADAHNEYAKSVYEKLMDADIRVELDDAKEGLGKKIRNTREMKTPYWAVIGDAEIKNGTVTLEHRTLGKIGEIKVEEIAGKLLEEIKNKK